MALSSSGRDFTRHSSGQTGLSDQQIGEFTTTRIHDTNSRLRWPPMKFQGPPNPLNQVRYFIVRPASIWTVRDCENP